MNRHEVVTLLGRDAELRAIARSLDAAAGGHGQLLAISGEPGIGKTALVGAAADLAEARGFAVTRGRAWDSRGAPVHWLWAQVLRELGCTGHDELEAEPSPAAVATRLRTAMAAATHARPLLVVLDDLHAASVPAVRVLRALAAELPALPVLILATFRSSISRASEGVRELLTELAAAHRSLQLHGLTPDEVAGLMAAVGEDGAPSRSADVHAASGGNPLLATMLLRTGHVSSIGGDHPEEPPEELRAQVRLQLEGLPEATGELLDVVTILSRRTSVDAVAATAGIDVAAVQRLLAPAVEGGVLVEDGRRLRFVHDIVRATLYADMSPATRVRLHQRAATALGRLDGDDPRVRAEAAHHAYHASMGTLGPPMRARLVAAAGDARAAGAPAEAASLLAHAVDSAESEGAGPEVLGPLLADLAEVQQTAHQHEAAERSWQSALALARHLGDGDLLARAAVGTARSALFLGLATPEHVLALEDALALLDTDRTAARATVLAHLGSALYWTPERRRGVALVERALAMARADDDPTALAAALLASHYVARGAERATERAALAVEAAEAGERAGDGDLVILARSALVVDQRELGDPEAVAAAIAALRGAADGQGHSAGRWIAGVHSLVSALLAGDPGDVEALGRSVALGVEGARERRYLTEFARVMTDLRPLLPDERKRITRRIRRLPAVVSWRARALLDDVERGAEDVQAELGAIVALLRAQGRGDAHWLLAVALTAEAVALLGDARRARILIDLLEPHAGSMVVASRVGATRGTARFHLGLLLLTAGSPAAAVAHLEAAEDIHVLAGHLSHLPRTRAALQQARAALAGPGSDLGVLARRGACWTLERGGRTAEVAETKGLRYLAHLLAAPGRSVPALDLLRLDTAGAASPAVAGAVRELELDGGGADALLDETAKQSFRARLGVLAEEIERAEAVRDTARTVRLRGERTALEQALAAGIGLGGRDRRLPSEAERARTSVTKALRGAVERLREIDPEVGAHLHAAVQTGAHCAYAPQGARLRVRG